MIGHVWPEPNTTAAGERILQLIQLFQAENHQVVFVSAASETKHSANLTELGIQTSFINLNDPAFDRLISELEPDIVIFDRFMVEEQFGWRVTENCPEAIRILNTEDLHSLREYRETCFKKDQTFSAPAWLQQDKTKREIASIYRSDLTLLTSSFEEKILLEALKIASELLLHLPFMYALPEKQTITGWPTFSERVDFVTYGNGKHTPNIDSFEYLKTTIWPLIRKALPEAKSHVYGAYFSQHLIQMNDPSNGFLVHGWEQDLASA
ncbi:MAG: glycosyltransferase, partial [Bacteroidota bacterium]